MNGPHTKSLKIIEDTTLTGHCSADVVRCAWCDDGVGA